jgi:hypothetical protein
LVLAVLQEVRLQHRVVDPDAALVLDGHLACFGRPRG